MTGALVGFIYNNPPNQFFWLSFGRSTICPGGSKPRDRSSPGEGPCWSFHFRKIFE